jgi:hypothetical protein
MPALDLKPKKRKKGARAAPIPPRVAAPRYVLPTFPGEHPVPARLAKKLKKLGRRFLWVRLGESLTWCCIAALVLVALQMALDWLLNLPRPARAAILGGDVVLLGLFLYRSVLGLILHPLQQETCALLVEKHWPKFRGRIIAAVQLAGPRLNPGSSELVRALQRETDAEAAFHDFREIVSARTLVRRAGTALAVAAVWTGLLLAAAPDSIALLERVFLLAVPIPRKTDVVCLSGDKILATGSSVLLEAQARGVVPLHGLATLTYQSGRVQEITLDPEPDHSNRFSVKIDRLNESFHYVIQLNDGISRRYEVKIVPRPYVAAIACEQIYPAYTGLPDLKRMVGNLALLAGSHLKIQATANAKIARASLKLLGLNQVLPLAVKGADNKELTGEIAIPATGLTGFSIQLTNPEGITSGDETEYRIDIVPDRPPTITLTYPDQVEQLATLKAKPTISFQASDDYGLAKVFLCYRVVPAQDAEAADTGATAPAPPEPTRIEMDLGDGHPLTLQRRYRFDPAVMKPPAAEGMTIEYWMEAQDANNVTGPGIGASEHHTIKFVSEMELRADVMRRLNEDLGVTSDLLDNQKKANDSLGEVIQDKGLPK